MKKIISALILISVAKFIYAQPPNSDDRNIRREEYEKFLGQILSTNGSNPTPSFLIDLADNPTLKLSLPVYKYFNESSSRNFFFIDGKLSSKSNYTPLISKGKWLPDMDINLSYTYLINRGVFFYTNEIAPGGIASMPISKASSIKFSWLNSKIGYNYSEYKFYNPKDTLDFKDRITDKKYSSFFIKANSNYYWFPSKNKTPWLTLYANLGYEFKTNDNNYSKLTLVDVRKSKIYNDTINGVLEVVEDEGKARTGKFIIGNSHSVPFNLSLLLSSKDKNFYVGLNFFGVNKTLIENSTGQKTNTTDLGVSINLPIQKSDEKGNKSVVNFTLRLDYPDISNATKSELPMNKRRKLGFTLAVPLIPRHK